MEITVVIFVSPSELSFTSLEMYPLLIPLVKSTHFGVRKDCAKPNSAFITYVIRDKFFTLNVSCSRLMKHWDCGNY